jgi:hypothetical protein
MAVVALIVFTTPMWGLDVKYADFAVCRQPLERLFLTETSQVNVLLIIGYNGNLHMLGGKR